MHHACRTVRVALAAAVALLAPAARGGQGWVTLTVSTENCEGCKAPTAS